LDGQSDHGSETPPRSFLFQLKGVLEHLHDLGYLHQHPLAQEYTIRPGVSPEIAGQRLRRNVLDGIEALDPGKDVPPGAAPARLHSVLVRRYVDAMTIRQTAEAVSVSPRQVLRDLRQAEKTLAVVLWARRSTPLSQEGRFIDESSVRAEMALLETHSCPTDICVILRQALESVALQAKHRRVCLRSQIPAGPFVLSVDPMMAEQVLVAVLSRAIGEAGPGSMYLELATGREGLITVQYTLSQDASESLVADSVVLQLADRLQWVIDEKGEPDRLHRVLVHMAGRGPTVLVIDDNQGLVNLLERYLSDQACRVVAATDGTQGLQWALTLMPDAIVLDVMMPNMSGWEVLQRLKTHPATSSIPVIVCSVINNPDLAWTLGASIFLPKPIRRRDVLSALETLGVVSASGAVHSR